MLHILAGASGARGAHRDSRLMHASHGWVDRVGIVSGVQCSKTLDSDTANSGVDIYMYSVEVVKVRRLLKYQHH